MRLRSLTLLLGVIISITALAQESEEKKFVIKGYLKNMGSFNYFNNDLWIEDLTHNRLNLAWYPNKNFSAFVEFRNRLLIGDFVSDIPNYAQIIDSNNDFLICLPI